MKNLFHKRLYFEGLKKIMIPGIVAAIIVFSNSILPPLVNILFGSSYSHTFIRTYADFASDVSLLWILTPCLIYSMFCFLNKRRQADFYHAIPVKRSTMLTTMLASVYTWVWGILIVSVGLSALLWWLDGNAVVFFSSLLLTVGMYMVATLYIGGFVILAMSISGTGFSNLTVSCLLFFSFRILSLIFYAALSTEAPIMDLSHSVLAIFDVKYWFPAALAESMSSTANLFAPFLWIFTGAVMIGCYTLAYVAFIKRKSQFAGQTAPERWLRRLYSTLVAMPLMFVGFVLWLLIGDGLSASFILFVLTVIIYFIYELISSKKLREAIASLKFLCIPIVCCLCLVGAIYGIAKVANNTHYTAEEMQSIRLYDGYTVEYTYWDENGESFEGLSMRDVSVDDLEARKIVSDAWKKTLENKYSYKDDYLYQHVEIRLTSGKTIGRELCFASEEYSKLMNIIVRSDECVDQYTQLPATDDILIYKDVFTDQVGYAYLKNMWNAFVKEYNALSTEEKILFKQQYSNQIGLDREEPIVHLYVSGVTDRQESFYADYVIPESFAETRKVYAEAMVVRQKELLQKLDNLCDMHEEQFRTKYSWHSMDGEIRMDGKRLSFSFEIADAEYNISNENRFRFEDLKSFVETVIPHTTTSFGDENCILISVYEYNTEYKFVGKAKWFVLGLKEMTDAERTEFLEKVGSYITNSNE